MRGAEGPAHLELREAEAREAGAARRRVGDVGHRGVHDRGVGHRRVGRRGVGHRGSTPSSVTSVSGPTLVSGFAVSGERGVDRGAGVDDEGARVAAAAGVPVHVVHDVHATDEVGARRARGSGNPLLRFSHSRGTSSTVIPELASPPRRASQTRNPPRARFRPPRRACPLSGPPERANHAAKRRDRRARPGRRGRRCRGARG